MSEDQLTRPVSGYLTKTGQFFEQQEDALMYDAIHDVNETLTEYLKGKQVTGALSEFILNNVKFWMANNKKAVTDYIEHVAVDKVEEPPELPDPPTAPVVTLQQPRDLFEAVHGQQPDELYTVELDEELKQDATLYPDFVSAFEDTVGEDEPAPEETGDDGEIRLDGVPPTDV